MHLTIQQLCKGFDLSVHKVRKLSKNFCDPLGITTFGYVRIYHNGCINWLTSNSDQDCFLIDSGALNDDPLINTPDKLKKGSYLWFNDRQFPGSETFYQDRAKRFHMDHGMVVVRHQKNYLETCCFSGLLAKRPLYNLFMNQQGLFHTFMDYFVNQLDEHLLSLLDNGMDLKEIKNSLEKNHPKKEPLSFSAMPSSLLKACGCDHLMKLSKREKECLALLKQGYSYQGIGHHLKLSSRTIEHYLESVKNKLGLETRSQLYFIADKIVQLDLME